MSIYEFPADVPKPGSMYSGEAMVWYYETTEKLRAIVGGVNDEDYSIEDIWSAVSRVRYIVAMCFIDQEVAVEFLREHPLPSISQIVDKVKKLPPESCPRAAIDLLLTNNPPVEPELTVVNDVMSYQQVVAQYIQNSDYPDAPNVVFPPRPFVPNPEYIPVIKPFLSDSNVWGDAPEIEYADSPEYYPALLMFENSLWLSYLSGQHTFSIIKFSTCIEYQQSRIGNLLPAHPYYAAGLKNLRFNELSTSTLTRYWTRFGARHWVINFHDRTLDVVAVSVEVVLTNIQGEDSFSILRAAIQDHHNRST